VLPRWLRRGSKPDRTTLVPPRLLDALVTLGEHHIPSGIKPGEAIAAVKAAIARLPAAGWVSVEYHPVRLVPDPVDWVEMDETQRGRSAGFRTDLVASVAAALAALARSLPAAVQPRPFAPSVAVTGFAEAPPPGLHYRPPATNLSTSADADADVSDTVLLQRLLVHATGVTSGAAAPAAIQRFGSLAHVLAAPGHELAEVSGLGEHSVAAIKLVHALALRRARSALMGQPVADHWERLLAYLRSAIAREKVEQFRILFLDAAGRLIADEAQARGTVNHTPVYPREVVRRALELHAASLILVHNHPSGDPTPSPADVDMTAQVEAAGRVLGVAVFDHLIVGSGRCLSFREAGLLAGEHFVERPGTSYGCPA
jgi:DNA repair protein RadC